MDDCELSHLDVHFSYGDIPGVVSAFGTSVAEAGLLHTALLMPQLPEKEKFPPNNSFSAEIKHAYNTVHPLIKMIACPQVCNNLLIYRTS